MTTTPDPLAALAVIDAIYADAPEQRPALAPNHPSHAFGGEDGRCMWCDARPYGRHAPYACPFSPDVRP